MSKRRRLSRKSNVEPPKKKQKIVEEEYIEENNFMDDSSDISPDEESSEELLNTSPLTESQNKEERGGTIREVILENFMCHKHLKTVLKPKINFLTGPNGSGKSAVLVAIAVGLGAKSSFTNRGKRIDSVITNGKNHTRISITIYNGDRDPFKHDLYGDTITIERYIKRGGSSSYKIKNCHGKTVNHTRAEVIFIIEHYNIQVNNPCAILMQDTSRQYLAESTPKSKYSFYLKATQLEKIRTDYDVISNQVTVMQNLLQKKKDTLKLMKNSVKALEAEYNDLKKLRTLEADISRTKDKLAWALIQQKEISKLEVEETEKKIIMERDKAASGVVKIETSKGQAEEDLLKNNEIISEVKIKLTQLLSEKRELDSKQNGLNKEFRICKVNEKDFAERKKQCSLRLQTLRNKIKQIQQDALKDSEAEEKHLHDQLNEIRRKLENAENEKSSIQDIIKTKIERKKTLENEAYEFQRLVGDKRNERTQLRKKLENLQNRKKEKASMFGVQMPALLQLIRQNISKFRKPPIGPIGLEIKLSDSSWATAVDAAIGGLLPSFVVDNHENDEKILKELCRRCNFRNISMIVQKHESTKYSIEPSHLPPKGILTISSVVQCKSPMVYNTLIDQANFHLTALMKERTEAERLVQSRNTVIQTTYLPDGSRIFVKNGATNFVSNLHPTDRLAADVDVLIRGTDNRLIQIEKELKEVEHLWNNKKHEIDSAQREIKQQQAKVQSASSLVRNLNYEISEIESELKVRSQPADVDEMLTSAQKTETELEKNAKLLEEEKQKMPSLREQINSILDLQTEKENTLEEFKEKLEQGAQAIRKIQDKLGKCESLYKRYSEKVLKLDNVIKELQAQQNTIQQELDSEIEKLQKNGICSREDVGEITQTPAQLDKQITVLETRLNTQLSAGGRKSIDDVMRECVDAKNKYLAISKQYGDLETFCNHVKNELQTRFSDWKKLRSLTAKQIRSRFTGFLSQKGYAGAIHFDHKNKSLDITVQLEKFRESSKSHKQTVNSLSGGERSFSTVSLLMALWATMETPFTAMDEFDVFMDQISRMKSTEMLLSFARGCSNRQQFIFITPQSLQNVEPAPDLHIINMFPPR